MRKLPYAIAREEYENLNEEDKKLYDYLRSLKPIDTIIHDTFDDLNVFSNFKTERSNSKTSFSFDVLEALEGYQFYQVEGFCIRVRESELTVYTIKSRMKNGHTKSYVSKRTMIEGNIALCETTEVKKQLCNGTFVSASFVRVLSDLKEEKILEIDEDDKLYQRYFDGEISLQEFYGSMVRNRGLANKLSYTKNPPKIPMVKKS